MFSVNSLRGEGRRQRHNSERACQRRHSSSGARQHSEPKPQEYGQVVEKVLGLRGLVVYNGDRGEMKQWPENEFAGYREEAQRIRAEAEKAVDRQPRLLCLPERLCMHLSKRWVGVGSASGCPLASQGTVR